ncbi:hypothetical protein A1QO_04110 [Vibrio genomosp. F10 str. ZF-129]|uniref:Uncharacterized protein n=1 Tax=Vibrio genomosp. F10 str. ZF-129 TaxID=1187848 RepID=A0A1E5BIN3_9VIBR|nr:hypothetical protein [Vibrio genomosp. F10]OEE37296.1 hypothetical protein A1QO_04110 [Vibrio genomosp. F10 str. ZF-129]
MKNRMTLKNAVETACRFSDKPLSKFTLHELKKCIKRAAFINHPDRSVIANNEKIVLINQASATIKDASKSAIEMVLHELGKQAEDNRSFKEHPLYGAKIPSWCTLAELIDDKYNVVEPDMTPYINKTVKPNVAHFWTRDQMEIHLQPVTSTLMTISLTDNSSAMQWNGKVTSLLLSVTIKKASSISVWGVLQDLFTFTKTNTIRSMFDGLLGLSKVDLGEEYEHADIRTNKVSGRYCVCPIALTKVKPITVTELEKTFLSKTGPDLRFLARIIGSGQFHQFILKGGADYYGCEYSSMMISNPIWLFLHVNFIESISLDNEVGVYSLSFYYKSGKYSMDIDLNNRYPDSEYLESIITRCLQPAA